MKLQLAYKFPIQEEKDRPLYHGLKNTPLDKKNKCWQTFSSSPIKRDKHWRCQKN